jgi:hypothetical protein
MTKPFFAVLFLILFTGITSCKKDNNQPTTNAETPMQTTIAQNLVVNSVGIYNTGAWEFGQKFYFAKNGHVTKLGCKMANTGQFRVCFWDFNTKNIIAATTVSITDSTNFFYNTVTPIPVNANVRYVVSVNNTTLNGISKDYYLYEKSSNGSLASIYPFTTGNVTYEAKLEVTSVNSAFPTTVVSNSWNIIGVADLEFEPAE